MLTPITSGRFKRDVKRAERRKKDMNKLKSALSLLIAGKPLRLNTKTIRYEDIGAAFAMSTSNRIGYCSTRSKATNSIWPAPEPAQTYSTNDLASGGPKSATPLTPQPAAAPYPLGNR